MRTHRLLYRGTVAAVLVSFLTISSPGVGHSESSFATQPARHADSLTDFTVADHTSIMQAAIQNLPALLAVQAERGQLASPNAVNITGGNARFVWPPAFLCQIMPWLCGVYPPYLLNAAGVVTALDGTASKDKMTEAARLLPTVNKKYSKLNKKDLLYLAHTMKTLKSNHPTEAQFSSVLDSLAKANKQKDLKTGFQVAQAMLKDGASTIYNPQWIADEQTTHWGSTPEPAARIKWWKIALADLGGAIGGSLGGPGGAVLGGIGASVGALGDL